jgi:tripartite ATP-independent transporter DctM subunit
MMSGFALAGTGFALMLLLIFLRMPIAVAMMSTGFIGVWVTLGSSNVMLSQLKTLTYDTFSNYSLTIIPLFLLMGQFATKSGMSQALFQACADWLGHRKGGVAMASVGACAGFGAVCGSSLATASTMGQVALPQMRRLGYSGSISTGVLAAGGTLGILIPPSIILVIYAIQTEQNIVKMFAAALIPGILAALGYMLVVAIVARFSADAAVAAPRVPYSERWKTLAATWPVVAIFALVIGGIYLGWFTPTEGAAVGAVTTGLYGLWTGGLNRHTLPEAITETAVTSAMIFFILLGAQMFNTFLAFTQAPQALADFVASSGWTPLMVLAAMLVTYLIFGCVMDSLSMILLTIPLFFPIIEVLDFGMSPEETAIWFGILALIVVEVGLITPPVGMNLFIINSLATDVPMKETYRGVLPFVASDILRVVLLVAFPSITLWLVSFVG